MIHSKFNKKLGNSFLIFALFLSLIFQSCNRFEDFSVDFQDPNSLALGTTMVWVNGELYDFLPIRILKLIGADNFSIQARKDYNGINGRTGFSFISIHPVVQEFELTKNEDSAKSDQNLVYVNAASALGVDEEGAEFKYIRSDDELFEITFLDLEKEQAAGRFRARFKMNRSRGYTEEFIGLPKFVTLEGIFFEEFL